MEVQGTDFDSDENEDTIDDSQSEHSEYEAESSHM